MQEHEAVGHISLVQEERFRLITDDGRGFLLTLGRKAGVQLADLQKLRESHAPVRVEYLGEPNTTSGVAEVVETVG